MKKILQSKDPVLRKVAKEVVLKEIKAPKIQKILREMSASLKSQFDGVAIAAPQIGYSLRIFVVSGRVLDLGLPKEKILDKKENPKKTKTAKDLVFINPKISKLSKEKEWVPEGCLSVRPFYGKTYRSKKALLTAYNANGKKFSRGASGLLAQVFQHETDHLEGILFIDHAKDIKEDQPARNAK